MQMKSLGKQIKRGDVILSNHPCAGGSHLPDLTVRIIELLLRSRFLY